MGITGRAAILSACLAVNSAAMAQDFKVTLLGTGVPFPAPDRFGAATLVEAGRERLLFDVGRGATIRLNQLGVPMGTLNAVFLTHFHSDHTSGIPDLWLTGWIGRYYSNRQSPFRVICPFSEWGSSRDGGRRADASSRSDHYTCGAAQIARGLHPSTLCRLRWPDSLRA